MMIKLDLSVATSDNIVKTKAKENGFKSLNKKTELVLQLPHMGSVLEQTKDDKESSSRKSYVITDVNPIMYDDKNEKLIQFSIITKNIMTKEKVVKVVCLANNEFRTLQTITAPGMKYAYFGRMRDTDDDDGVDEDNHPIF